MRQSLVVAFCVLLSSHLLVEKTSAFLVSHQSKDAWTNGPIITVLGDSLRTWSLQNEAAIERVGVFLKSQNGSPLNAGVELWNGPGYTPQKMDVYIEDGNLRPFSAVIETPRCHNTIAIRNRGRIDYPIAACVGAEVREEACQYYHGSQAYAQAQAEANARGQPRLEHVTRRLRTEVVPRLMEGGDAHVYPLHSTVASIQVLLKTTGLPLHARIEILQGPNQDKQVVEIYCEDGHERPFFAVIETPGSGNAVRIVNTGEEEFPMYCALEPHKVDEYFDNYEYEDAAGYYRNMSP